MAEVSSKTKALSIINAVEEGNLDKFDQAFSGVDDNVVAMLEKFLIEVVTAKYEVFDKSDAPLLASNPNYARSVLISWKKVGSARAKMSARMAFEAITSISRRTR